MTKDTHQPWEPIEPPIVVTATRDGKPLDLRIMAAARDPAEPWYSTVVIRVRLNEAS